MTAAAVVTSPTRPARWWDQDRVVALVVAMVALVAALAGLGVPSTYGARTTADEPHYLLTALSLAEDGDLDIADELADERWRDFHEVDLPLQERVLPDGRMVAPHDPLLPLLAAPFVAVGGWVGAKVLLALVAGATAAATVLLATRRMRVPARLAGVATAVAFASWPLAGYGAHVYPELPAALATVVATWAATTRRPRPRHLVVLVTAVVALPWLAVKYVPVAAAVAAVALWRLRARRTALATVTSALALAGIAWLAVHQVVWTGWTPYASADHFAARGEFSVVGFAPDPLGRSRRVVGLLLDRDFGLGAWQPAWLAAPAGLAVGLGDRVGRDLVAVVAAGWATATLVALTMHGWWIPGRQVVIILPLVVVLVAAWLDRTSWRWPRPTLAVAGSLGVVTYAWLVADGLAGDLTWVVDFATVGDPSHALRRMVLPDYLRVTARTWVAHGIGATALGLLAVTTWRDVRVRPRGSLPPE